MHTLHKQQAGRNIMSAAAAAGLSQQFCVRWNSHLGSLGAAFPQLLAGQRFVDVTLACEGHQVHCHRLVLAACSTYFENLLGENPCQHPIIILPRDIKLWAIQALVDFMYKGEVNVSQAGLPDLMKCAEILKIRGLCGSDAALNLNQIHSPHQHQHAGGNDAVDGGDSAKPSEPSFPTRHGNGQFQTQHDLSTRSYQNSTSSGPKRQLLNSLNLQPIDSGSQHQNDDGGNQSDNGESGNEMCIKTEDLIIDEDDTGSRQCADDEELPMDGNDKNSSDANRCEQQFLGVADAMHAEDRVVNVRLARDALQDRMQEEEEEAEVVEEGDKMIDEGCVTMERSDESQTHSDHPDFVQDDYANFANENEGDDDEDDVLDNDVMEVRDETEGTLATPREGVPGRKEMRKKVRKVSTNHQQRGADANNEQEPSSTVSSIQQGKSANVTQQQQQHPQQQQRANGARSIGAMPSLSSISSTVRSSPGGSRGSIRVKSIENLFENYHAKQSPKSSRGDKRKLGHCGGANNSEHDSASEHASGVGSSLLYNRTELDIYVKQQQQQHQRILKATDRQTSAPTADGDASGGGGGETNASMGSDGDGYENIICSPNFPQLAGVVGGYKAEEEDEDEEEYGDEYAIQLLAEEIDSSVLANGGESDGDEILYKPSPLMAGGTNAKPSMMRSYSRGVAGGMVSNGTAGATSTLTIRKIERQARGNMGVVSQSTSLARPNRRPRLTGRSKDALNQLLNANGAPPPIAFTLRNPRGNQPRTYNTEALWAALMDVKAGESIYRASQMHKVPRKTLRNWMKRWDIKSAYPMPRQLKEAAEKKRIIKELTSQIQ